MRILITGGAGFIGSQIADAYLKAGHEVAVLDSFASGRRENLAPNVTVYEGDIADSGAVERAFSEFQPQARRAGL